MKRYGLHSLSLAFCPLSNQECEWLRDDPDVKSEVQDSKLYMIGQRREVKFANFKKRNNRLIEFDLVCGSDSIRSVRIPIAQFHKGQDANLIFELGPKIILIKRDSLEKEIIHWFTPDRLFFYYSHREVKVAGLDDFRRFAVFDLFYVGISKAGDSLSRLFKTAHEKRSRILGNEAQYASNARLTDELMIFLFVVKDLQVISYGLEDIDAEFALQQEYEIDLETIAADAEKAFIRIMKSKYNTATYKSYPKSVDGLWKHSFDRYGFFINESITFRTAAAIIRGGRNFDLVRREQADGIFIEGESVTLFSVESTATTSTNDNLPSTPK